MDNYLPLKILCKLHPLCRLIRRLHCVLLAVSVFNLYMYAVS